MKTHTCNYNQGFSFFTLENDIKKLEYINPWGFVSEDFYSPESLVVHALIAEEVVLEIQLSEV